VPRARWPAQRAPQALPGPPAEKAPVRERPEASPRPGPYPPLPSAPLSPPEPRIESSSQRSIERAGNSVERLADEPKTGMPSPCQMSTRTRLSTPGQSSAVFEKPSTLLQSPKYGGTQPDVEAAIDDHANPAKSCPQRLTPIPSLNIPFLLHEKVERATSLTTVSVAPLRTAHLRSLRYPCGCADYPDSRDRVRWSEWGGLCSRLASSPRFDSSSP
jgi:hypothetical protein